MPNFSTDELKNQFEQLAEHIPMAVALFDRELRYLFASPRWISDFHLPETDIIGKNHYEIFPEIGEAWKDIHQRCLEGHIHKDDEVPFHRMDGSLDWLRREIRPWYACDGSIGGLMMYVEIITERKKARDELQAQHRFLRQVVDLNTSFIFAKDEQGSYTLVNKALADAYGSVPEEMVGKYDEDYNINRLETKHFRSDDLEVVRSRRAKFIPEESVTSVTGETRWYQTIKVPLISEDGETVQLLGIATDITERKKAQDELQAQHRFLRQVIDLNTSLIFAKDEEGNFLLVNKTLANAFGANPEEMVGKSDKDYNTNLEQVHNIYSDDMEVLRTRRAKFVPEEPITGTVTGKTRWYQTTKVPLISDDGESVQLLGVATDITERKHVEEQLQRLVIQEQEARQAAEAASKMKDLFMANMSHELRTPLNAIIGFLREMLYSEQLDSDNQHMAQRCLENSKRLHMLINSVLDLSRLAVGSLELVIDSIKPLELASYIKEDLFIPAKEKGLDFRLIVDEALPERIKHDEERLTQIISNLLVNAIKFTRKGHVQLELRRGEGERLIIEVSDTGVGIPQDMQSYIFESFVQGDIEHPKQGVGLGLSIVKNLAELMGGGVFLLSTLNSYTVFTVDLPLNLEA
jgi:PAS domain S-box-containing protein